MGYEREENQGFSLAEWKTRISTEIGTTAGGVEFGGKDWSHTVGDMIEIPVEMSNRQLHKAFCGILGRGLAGEISMIKCNTCMLVLGIKCKGKLSTGKASGKKINFKLDP